MPFCDGPKFRHDHALSDPKNKTKFTLLFANVTEKDILMREQLDGLAKAHPDSFKVVYILDKADSNWTGATGYINSQLIKQHAPSADLKEKAKVFVCGAYLAGNFIADSCSCF